MKVDRSSPVRPARSVAQAAYARRIEAGGGIDSVDAVSPAASVLLLTNAETMSVVISMRSGELDNRNTPSLFGAFNACRGPCTDRNILSQQDHRSPDIWENRGYPDMSVACDDLG